MAAVSRVSADPASAPVAVENARGAGGFVVVCDHASNRFPDGYGTLGLTAEQCRAHIAWDPGALGVSRGLVRRLDAPLIHSTVSRLVVDCNRAPDAPDLIPEVSETTVIPGNAKLMDAERQRRIDAFHVPFHDAIARILDERLERRVPTALVGIHSFTPIYRGFSRPWEIGILFDRDRRLADPLIESLSAEGLNVGSNQPYSPADRVYATLARHGGTRGLATVMIEIRNDLLATPADEERWAARLAPVLAEAAGASAKSSRGN